MNKKHVITLIALFVTALAATSCDSGQPSASPPAGRGAGQSTPTGTVARSTDEVGPSVLMSDLEQVYITTTSNNMVGIGSYVAAEAYGIAAGADPNAQPAQAFIMPYAIEPEMKVADINSFDPSAFSYRIRQEGFTYHWELSAPAGSKAALIDKDGVQVFLADVRGQYTLALTATDSQGHGGADTWAITAGTYVGVGPLDGSAKSPTCAAAGCHQERAIGEWASTKHATMFTQAIDGKRSAHYAANCISCHTTGFNNRPEAASNGGFFDVASQAGWKFPGAQTEGNWAEIVSDYPQAAALANIQCESCHGPGSEHVTGDPNQMGSIGRGLGYGDCAQCHAQGPYFIIPQQWETSGHAAQTAEAFWTPIGESRSACVRCHTGGGFIDYANGLPQDQWRTDYNVISCAVCHDAHNVTNPFQVRAYNTASLANGYTLAGAGMAANCMNCHNTRVDPDAAVDSDLVEITSGEFAGMAQIASLPHYSNSSELIAGTGGYTWGQNLPGSLHGQIVENTCVGCHMAETPGMDTKGTDDTADDMPLPGHNTVGGHTFAMRDANGVENVAACLKCHPDIVKLEFKANGDFDGDGTIETNSEEVSSLLRMLQTALEANGAKLTSDRPYIVLPPDSSVDVKGAAFNYKFIMGKMDNQTVSSRSASVHNLRYTVSLLQLSIEKLTGAPVPNGARP